MKNTLLNKEFFYLARLPLLEEKHDILSSWGYILFGLGTKRIKEIDLVLQELQYEEYNALKNPWYN